MEPHATKSVCVGGHVQNPKSNPKSRRNVPEFQGNALLVYGGRRGVGGGGSRGFNLQLLGPAAEPVYSI